MLQREKEEKLRKEKEENQIADDEIPEEASQKEKTGNTDLL